MKSDRGGRHKARRSRRARTTVAAASAAFATITAAGLWFAVTAAPAAPAASPTTRLDADAASVPSGMGAKLDSVTGYVRSPMPLSRDAPRLPPPPVQSPQSTSPTPGRSGTTSGATWVLPTPHLEISTWFGERGWYWASGYHTGIDFVGPCGTREVAVTAGRVVRAGWDGPYGYQVRLRLPNGDQIWYNHLLHISTHQHARLAQGGLIGLMGETGNAYGCHLHLEYHVHGRLPTPVDPAPYFAAHGLRLHVLVARARTHPRP